MARTFTFDYLIDRYTVSPPFGYRLVRDQETGALVVENGRLVVVPKED
tara:strand:- start:9028 stop:9171 length:144 start_codon:yes stop_codon:yes gene_type:complete